MILTHCLPWTQWSREDRTTRMRELAELGETHIVLTSKLLEAAAADSAYLITFAEEMKSFGLTFTDCHAFWGTWSDPGMPVPEWREVMLLRHRMAFRLCARYGITTMAFHTGNTFNSLFGKDLKLEDYYRSLTDSLDILLPEAEKCGVIIALENQWTPLNHTGVLLRVMEKYRSPYLGLCYDSGHGNLTEKGMQFYSGFALNDSLKDQFGRTLFPLAAFAFETQAHPDSVNKPDWPDTVLRPGSVFRSVTEYRWGVA